MLLVAAVRKERQLPLGEFSGEDMLPYVRQPRSDVPAITHVDYSARIQTIRREDHPEYYDLIRAFYERTGCPVIVNTSFNVRGEPIVGTPGDAYRCFMGTEMDALVLGRYLLLKEDQPPWPLPKGHVESDDAPETLKPQLAETLVRDLDEVYRASFLPAVGVLGAAGAAPFRQRPSLWTDANSRNDAPAVFVVPGELAFPMKDVEKTAAAIVDQWELRGSCAALAPVVKELISLRLRHPMPKSYDEEVPSSMYVVF